MTATAARTRDFSLAYASGASTVQIAQQAGISPAAVRERLLRAGVEMRGCEPKRAPAYVLVMMRAEGAGLARIAAFYGVSMAAISKRLKRAGVEGDPSALAPLLTLTMRQRIAYMEALDGDRLDHADALEIALEF